jgi:hypothetical protein
MERVYDFTKSNKHDLMCWSQSVLSEMEHWRDRMKSDRNLEPETDVPDDEHYKRRCNYYDNLVSFMEYLTDDLLNPYK